MERISNIFEIYANNPCLCELDRMVTYGELGTMVDEMSGICSTFQSAVLLFEQNIECVAFYLACLKNKKLIVLLDPQSTQADISHIAELFNVSLISGCFQMMSSHFLNIYSKRKFNIYRTHYNILSTPHPELAVLVNTSGSTSTPKFVKLSYDNLVCNTRQIIEYLPIDNHSFAGPPPPFSYANCIKLP